MQKLRIESGRYYIVETELITVPQSKKGRCIGCYAQHHACSAMGMRKICNGNGVIFVENKQSPWRIVFAIMALCAIFALALMKLMKP